MKLRAGALTLFTAMLFAAPAFAAAPNSMILTQPDATANLSALEVVIPAGLDRQRPTQSGIAALAAETILQTPVAAVPGQKPLALEHAIAAQGAALSYSVEAHDVRFYLEGLPRTYPQALALFEQVLAKPDFSVPTLDAARSALDRKRAQSERLPLSVGIDMLDRAFYANSDAGLPPYGLPVIVAETAPADVQRFYAAHYRRTGSLVSATGDLRAIPAASLRQILDVLPAGASPVVVSRTPRLPAASHELIARRNVAVPWLVAQYHAPELGSKDFGAMLVLTSFLQRTLADVSSLPTVETQSGAERGTGALYNFDARPANIVIYIDGGQGDPSRTFATALTVINVLGRAKLGGDLSQMKTYAVGRFLESSQTLQDRAWLAGVFASHHLGTDYVAQTVKAIDATTAVDLQRVALRYFGIPTIALVLPRAQEALQSP